MATGNIAMINAGDHRFCTGSDDGSWLSIDDNLVVSNGGLHHKQTICQNWWLSSGIHTILVQFFDHNGDEILEVSMDGSPINLGKDPVSGPGWGGVRGVRECIHSSSFSFYSPIHAKYTNRNINIEKEKGRWGGRG